MTTLQDLKDNRNEIIEYLVEELGQENVKEGMTIISKMIGFRGYDSLNVMAFCKAVIKDSGIKDSIEIKSGYNALSAIEVANREQSKRQMKHI